MNQAGMRLAEMGGGLANSGAAGTAAAIPNAANAAATFAAPQAGGLMGMLPQGVQDFGGRFAAAARDGLPPGVLSKYAPTIAGMGVMQGVSGAFAPKMPKPTAENNFNYEGPYTSPYREVSYPSSSRDPNDSSEYLYFRNTNPVPGSVPLRRGQP